ncbi:MAG TPA: ATP-binding protein [Vicinamibacterales bacterium]|nr:ATP-binding protein [Vicinamibacterales bacterium]
MRPSLTTKQTAAVTLLIAVSMTVVSIENTANLARVGLEDTRRTGDLMARLIYQRSRETIATGSDPHQALRADQGIRSLLESTAAYSRNVIYAAIVDTHDVAIAHSFPAFEGRRLDPQERLATVLNKGPLAQIRAIYADSTLEIVQPLQLGDSPFGAIRIGLSPVLIRNELRDALAPMLWTTFLISSAAIIVGLLLARRILRPIHVISTGLMRLRRGEAGVTIDLPYEEELKDVGESFKAIGEQLTARSAAGLTDARIASESARKLSATGRLMAGLAHEVRNPLNAMAIHLELVRQHLSRAIEIPRAAAVVEAVSSSSRSEPDGDAPVRNEVDGAREHVDVIAGEIRRLDEVIQGFLRFIRPQELQLQPVHIRTLFDDVLALVEPDVAIGGVICRRECPDTLPEVRADAALLRQALLNLALNGCQAMPDGGTLTLAAREAGDGRIVITVEDTGIGIPADQLGRIFDLYYTTRSGGSGIGLSMVYRIVQLHGGDVEVESTVGRGTSFRLLLPAA